MFIYDGSSASQNMHLRASAMPTSFSIISAYSKTQLQNAPDSPHRPVTDHPPQWQLSAAPAARLARCAPAPALPCTCSAHQLVGSVRSLQHPMLLPHPCTPALQRSKAALCRQDGPTQQGTACMGPESPWAAQAPSALRLATTLPCMPVHPVYLCTRLPVRRCSPLKP